MNKINELLSIMSALRDPEKGCPWDKQQDFASIAAYTVEEAYEVVDAIKRRDYADLKDELGDLLFQVVYHAQMAEEQGLFKFDDVVEAISAKMVRRHPHVFAAGSIDSEAKIGEAEVGKAEAGRAWEQHKQLERQQKRDEQNVQQVSVLDDVALALPALIRAQKLQSRAAGHGFDWPEIAPVFDKIFEEIDEIKECINGNESAQRLQDEVGDLLFACVNLARHLQLKAEVALQGSNEKFMRRFLYIEQSLADQGKPLSGCDLAELDALWDKAKSEERQ
ncbi:MAG: nucleoside triphosphate pyrophosphohydrolase [Gammaproteobacteria bacterium]|nr:nucleoside triphosphate pyrophosphohydrolase [Gammaproteobacteria bacterium]